jgi:hypothetical protein
VFLKAVLVARGKVASQVPIDQLIFESAQILKPIVTLEYAASGNRAVKLTISPLL